MRRTLLALGLLAIAACGARTDLALYEADGCPDGEQRCTACDGTQSCMSGPCPEVSCGKPQERFDSGCHEGEVGCFDCDGAPFCAYNCPLLVCEDLDAAGVTSDGQFCGAGESVCPIGCSDGITECRSGDACPPPPPCPPPHP